MKKNYVNVQLKVDKEIWHKAKVKSIQRKIHLWQYVEHLISEDK